MRKRLITAILLTFFFQNILLADAEILEFRAEPSPNQITLTWKTGQETKVSIFHIERSANDENFLKIGEVSPKGSNSTYEFIDDSISRTKSVYYFRIKVVNNNGTFQYSESLPVIPNVSSTKRTWGMIKALFR